MFVNFDPTGAGSIRSFRLRNEGSKSIAVRVQILTRESLEDGSERNDPVPEGSFLVFPSRFIIEAGASRTLKVQWRGGDPGEKELSFRIVAEQVPVALEERQGSGITFLFKFIGSLYIRSPKAVKADVRVVTAKGIESSGTRGIELRLRNEGGIHAILADFKMALPTSSGNSAELPESALSVVEGNNILAASERVFFIPYENAEVGVSYDARIDFKPES